MKELKSTFCHLICLQVLIVLSGMLSAQSLPAISPEEILEQRQKGFNQINALEDPLDDSLWYHGRIYEFDIRTQSGTPYFFNIGTFPGSITFNKKHHEDLILSYNLIIDELIIWEKGSSGNMMQLVLNKYFVDRFTLMHRGNYYHFRMQTETNPLHEELKEGFYEVVYDDELSLLVKHKKVLSFDATNDTKSYQYEKQTYLIRDGEFYKVDSRRDYLNAFQDNKNALRKYMRQEKINYKKTGTQGLYDLCSYSKSLLYH